MRFVFVHIQKTGGDSVRSALGLPVTGRTKHFSASEHLGRIGVEAWGSSFSFSFVRNPWDRLVSWWAMMRRIRRENPEGRGLNPFAKYILDNSDTFEEFLSCDEVMDLPDGARSLWRNQYDYLTGPDGSMIVSFVGRFERIESDFEKVARIIGRDAKVPHVNKSHHDHYSSYYTPTLARIVGERFVREVEAFGYGFEG